ncbi:BOP1 [Symbiodinium sp. KB8]|nr:BOP1 [Symbiodinium sp. KB8]
MHGRQAPKNTIGNVPLEWYRDYDHMGYTIDGKPLPKPAFAQMDAVDRFLASQDDPNFRWTVYDEQNGEEYVLSKRDVQILRNLQQGRYAHPEFNDTPDYIPYYTSEIEIHPLSSDLEPKRRFLPSKWEVWRAMRHCSDLLWCSQPLAAGRNYVIVTENARQQNCASH